VIASARNGPKSGTNVLELRGSVRFAEALAEGYGLTEGSRRAGIAKRTGSRRLQDPDFVRHVRELRAQILDEAGAKLARGATRAVDVLLELLDSDSEMVRLSAARTILERLTHVRDSIEVEERLRQLEERARVEEPTPATGRRW